MSGYVFRKFPESNMRELILDRLALWEDWELRELAERYAVPSGEGREAQIDALAARIVASRDASAFHRARAAGMVATVVKRRWKEAHVTRWRRDAGGRPVPWSPGAVHTYVVSYRGTTPSGRNLIRCTGCAMKLTDVLGRDHACPGFERDFLTASIAAAIEGGVVYAPGATSLPLPEPGPVLCLRCWTFGAWTKVDRAVRQRVCDACFELPFPDACSRSAPLQGSRSPAR